MENYFKLGQDAARYFYSNNSAFRGMDYHGRPEDIARLFLPPEAEQLIQIARPLSTERQQWLDGFNEVKNEIH